MKKQRSAKSINLLNNLDDKDFIDSDSDGLLDKEEELLGTDPYNPDTDNDGLCDYEEVYVYGTDPLDPDTDHDGMKDGNEVRFGYNPKGPGRLKDFFLASRHNNFKPHALHTKRIVFYILAALLIKAVVVISLVALPMDAWLTQDVAAEQSKKVIALTNQIRAKKGLKNLAESTTLNQAAISKAQDMISNQYFSHVSPENHGLSYWLSLVKYGFFTAGENLAMGFSDAADIVNAWTQSKTHYANLIDPDYTQIGVAMATGKYKGFDTTFVAQMFGTPKTQIQPVKKSTVKTTAQVAASNTSAKTIPIKTIAKVTAFKKTPIVQTVPKGTDKKPILPPSNPIKEISVALPNPQIITPEDGLLTNQQNVSVKVFAPVASQVILFADGMQIAKIDTKQSYADFSIFLDDGKHLIKAIAVNGNQEKTSNEITTSIDTLGPQIDLANSNIRATDDNQDHKVIDVTAILSADTVKAEATFSNYSIELKPEENNVNKWSGQTIIFNEKNEEILNPIVPASITATDRAGSTVTQDIIWENIKPLKQSLLNQYLYLKNNQSSYSSLLFDISSAFYKLLIVLAMAILGINLYLEFHKKHPHLIYSTVGLVLLLAVLIIV